MRKEEALKNVPLKINSEECPLIWPSLQPQSQLCIHKPRLTNLVGRKKKKMLKRKQVVFCKIFGPENKGKQKKNLLNLAQIKLTVTFPRRTTIKT